MGKLDRSGNTVCKPPSIIKSLLALVHITIPKWHCFYSLYIHIESQTKETHDSSFYFELNVNFSLFYYLLSFFYFLFYFFVIFHYFFFFLIFFAEDIERNTTGGRSGVELEGRKGRGKFLLVLINADSLIANFYHVKTHWQFMYVERSSLKTLDDIFLSFYIFTFASFVYILFFVSFFPYFLFSFPFSSFPLYLFFCFCWRAHILRARLYRRRKIREISVWNIFRNFRVTLYFLKTYPIAPSTNS